MEFYEFRTLWEELVSIKGKRKYAERLAEIKELLKDVPMDKLFCVDIKVLSDVVDNFFATKHELNAQFSTDYSAFGSMKNQILVLYLKNNRYEITKQFVLGRIVDGKYDLRTLLASSTQQREINALMRYAGLEEALWDTIQENYNLDRNRAIGIIKRRLLKNQKQIQLINQPNYVEEQTTILSAKIDEDQKTLEELQSKLDTICE